MPMSLHSSSLLDLQNPTLDLDIHIAALKQIKHEIIGHEQKKETLIAQGIVEPLARVLGSGFKRRQRGKGGQRKSWPERSNVDNGADAGSAGSGRGLEGTELYDEREVWTKEDELRLQATLVVGSLAMGGPAFLYPLFAGSIHNLLPGLSPYDYSSRLILATLNTLNTMVDVALLEGASGSGGPRLNAAISSMLYSPPHIQSLVEILTRSSSAPHQQEQLRLVARLIAKTCREEIHQRASLRAGVLDHLSSRLASLIVSLGYMLPSADPAVRDGLPPAPPKECLSYLLEAIGAIIHHSRYRTARFLYSPAILGVFPIIVQNSRDSSPFAQVLLNQQYLNPVQHLLPRIQISRPKVETSWSRAFPALGAFNEHSDFLKMPHSFSADLLSSALANSNDAADDNESPMCAWLLHMARTERGANRLAAAWLLTLVILLSKIRDRQLAFLMVPLLVQMIDEAIPDGKSAGRATSATVAVSDDVLRTREDAPAILAALIKDSHPLQASAVDASVIKKLCQMLKKSFDSVPNLPKPMWSLTPGTNGNSVEGVPETCRLGPAGIHPKIIHALRCRKGALEALAAIAQREDAYRKAIIENGVINCVVDSLTAYDVESMSMARTETLLNAKSGNPVSVVIAACGCARAISRSVSVLRTSLIDAGIAKPIFALLASSSITVKVAATDVLCNLLLEFSPMRKDLIEAGALETLCDHAHSANSRLRLVSLWALKHLVLSASNEIKNKCLEELGTGWLVQIISSEPGSTLNQSYPPFSMATPNAAGERVDILNAVNEPMTSVDEALQEDSEDVMGDVVPLPSNTRYNLTPKLRTHLEMLKRKEDIPAATVAMVDEVKIQEQGLDYIRNLITGTGSADMIDHLFSQIGSNRLFEILASKLKPRPGPWTTANSSVSSSLPPPSFFGGFPILGPAPPEHFFEPLSTTPTPTSTPSHNNSHHRPQPYTYRPSSFPHPPEIILSTIFTLVHIAAGPPKHRRLLLSFSTPQFPRGVIGEMVPHFESPDRRIRVACVWVVSNLTWVDDASDWVGARQRAEELRALGFVPPALFAGGGGAGGGGALGGSASGSGSGRTFSAAVAAAAVQAAGGAMAQGLAGGLAGGAAAGEAGLLARLLNDPDLDVRERTKTAVEQLGKLLDGSGAPGMGMGVGMGGGGASAAAAAAAAIARQG